MDRYNSIQAEDLMLVEQAKRHGLRSDWRAKFWVWWRWIFG